MEEFENYIEIRVGNKYCRAELREEFIASIDANDPEPFKVIVPKLVKAVHLGRKIDKEN